MAFRKRGKKPKDYKQNSKQRRPNRSGPPSPSAIELPIESRSPSPVALRNRKRRSGSESPNPDTYKRPTEWYTVEELDDDDGFYADGVQPKGYRVFPSNYLRFSKEVKHVDISANSFDVSAFTFSNVPIIRTDVFGSMLPNVAGTGAGQRSGDAVRVLRMAVKFQFTTFWDRVNNTLLPPPLGMTDWEEHHQVRVCIIRDKASQGFSAATDDLIWSIPNLNRYDHAFRLPSTTSRFEILYDQCHTLKWLQPVTYADGVSPGANVSVGWYSQWRSATTEVFMDKSFDVSYAASSTLPNTNNVFMVAYPGTFGLRVTRNQSAFISRVDYRCSFVDL